MLYTPSPPESLTLQPSELPLGCTAPLSAPADGRISGQGRIVLLRLVRLKAERFVLYARWNGRNTIALHQGKPQVWQGKPTPLKLQRVAARFGEEEFAWSFASICVISHRQSGRKITALGFDPDVSSPNKFYLWANADLSDTVGFQLYGDVRTTEEINLTTALNTPGSCGNFAHLWLQATPAERAEIWRAQVEKRAELEQLMKWVSWCVPEIWAQTGRIQLCSTRAYRADEWFFASDNRPYHSPQLSIRAENLILQWGQFWQARFLPIYALWLQENNHDLEFSMPTLGATIQAPTAHEQLEAHLHLRDWLQRNAPEQLDELLPA